MRFIATLVASLLIASPCLAGDVAYRPGKQFAEAWHAFYDLSDHEPEIDDPLIKRGRHATSPAKHGEAINRLATRVAINLM